MKDNEKLLMLETILFYLKRGYLTLVPQNEFLNYIGYFPVPKGSSDIRVVFNGTSCGLNSLLFASNV